MKHSRAESENTWHIEMAARQDKPFNVVGGIGGEIYILHLPAVREVPLPEPVDTEWVNGRPPGGWETRFGFCWLPPVSGEWEEAAIRSARERERRIEAVLLAGTLGQP